MDHYSIVASLRNVDKKFTQQLTRSEKQAAFRRFRKVYACPNSEQMSKLAVELTKRQKVQDNLSLLDKQSATKSRQIDQQIKRKLEKSALNKEKLQESLGKEIKMLDQNWKRKIQEINHKNRQKQKQSLRRAEKLRKADEQYWNNKKSFTAREVKQEQRSVTPNQNIPLYRNAASQIQNNLTVPNSKVQSNNKNNGRSTSNREYLGAKKESKKPKIFLPGLNNPKSRQKEVKLVSQNISDCNKSEDIKMHQERNEKTKRQREEANFQRIMQKLDKIEKSRKNAQEKLENQVKQAKRIRQLKESPQIHAANRERSLQQLHSNSKKKRIQKSKASLSASKNSLSSSMERHFQIKQRIREEQFHEREVNYEQKMAKLKRGKINRLVKEAINQLRQQTLNECE